MSAKKVVLAIIGWSILGFIFFYFLQVVEDPKVEIIRASLKDKALMIYNNFLESLAVSRKSSMTTVELEENLKHSLPIPFGSFSHNDWNWFWHLLYARFPEDSEGWPEKTSQLTRKEIEEELAYYYKKPFASFGQRQWDIFWQHILKGKVF